MWKSTTGSISTLQSAATKSVSDGIDTLRCPLSTTLTGLRRPDGPCNLWKEWSKDCWWLWMKIGNIGYSCRAQCALGIMQPKKWIRSESMEGPKLVRLQTWPNSSFASFVAFVLKNRTKSLNCHHFLEIIFCCFACCGGCVWSKDDHWCSLGLLSWPTPPQHLHFKQKGRFLWWPTF